MLFFNAPNVVHWQVRDKIASLEPKYGAQASELLQAIADYITFNPAKPGMSATQTKHVCSITICSQIDEARYDGIRAPALSTWLRLAESDVGFPPDGCWEHGGADGDGG